MNNNKHLSYPNSCLSERFSLVSPYLDNRGWTVLHRSPCMARTLAINVKPAAMPLFLSW